ncbi:MAG TPA: efflux RND transporter permease subunit, partial [Firmicutes bacterium]|nr:efflux RND transporter permease subunit [Bacillota bacterium]
IMKDVRETVDTFAAGIPGLQTEIRNDGSVEVKNSLNILGMNALLGVLLVFITLTLFIGWKNAVFAAWGIPFSFFLTFILMQRFDVTMNNLSLFGLILVLGMVVDDAIIVLENIQRHREQGLGLKDATIKGTEEIMWPVIAAVATTIAAFLPMLMMEGRMGRFVGIFPIVVSLALLASLFECLIVLPSHVSELGGKKIRREQPNKPTLWLQEKYRKVVRWALCHRAIVISIITMALILSGLALMFKLVKFEFFRRRTVKTLVLKLQTPVGTNLDKTNEVISKIENFILTMPEKEDIEAVVTTVGQLRENHQWKVETSNAEIRIDFKDADKMKFSQPEIRNKIRKFLDHLPGLYSYKFGEARGGPPTGDDVELRVLGDDLKKLESIGDYIMKELEKIPGIYDIESSFSPGKKEIQIIPYNDKISIYGLTVADIARVVGIASYGTVVSQYRGTGLEEYDIIVKGNEERFNTLSDIENLKIRTRLGDLVPLKELAEFRITSGYSTIVHRDGKRVITINANTGMFNDNGKMRRRTPDEVSEMLMGNKIMKKDGILSNFSSRFPGYRLEYGGVKEEQERSYRSLYIALVVALLFVYTILATQFKSWVQPLIVMTTIPFAFIGVIFGLLVTGLPFSLLTLIAVIALAGVVVNDSLVLVDFVNRERESGIDRWNSLIDAGTKRLRPIILTTITTIAGFMPMILSRAEASADWKPMAVSIAFGLAFATTLTLIVIPVIYSMVDDFFGKLKLTRFKNHVSFKEAMNKMPCNTESDKKRDS